MPILWKVGYFLDIWDISTDHIGFRGGISPSGDFSRQVSKEITKLHLSPMRLGFLP
jgi:hypothetical protein